MNVIIMKNRFLLTALSLIFLCIPSTNAQKRLDEVQPDIEYRRNSLYSVLIAHTDQKFAEEIQRVFIDMPTPDKYNDHDLSVKIVSAIDKKATSTQNAEAFLVDNHIASRLVSRWFNRNILTGECDVELVKSRGLYNANEFDKAMADRSARGRSILEDAGEELIGKTFVLMNDIRYADKENTGKAISAGLGILGAISSAAIGVDVSDLAESLGDMAETLKGFKVKITTHLYQLEWNDQIANKFYSEWYSSELDKSRIDSFNANRGYFTLKYIGSQDSKANDISFMGVNLDDPDAMVRKACQRSLDENIADLQRNFESFKIKVPILSADPITADVGLKEGVTKDSKFEVLEAVETDGKIIYERVGVITPAKDMIWDNRYMAAEERAPYSALGKTTFKKVSGKELYPGMLIREIK